MKLLDEKGIGTVWSICKEKFALVGHTHNYAGSGSPGGSANSAIGVVDYNQTGKTIQIGYSGTGITGDQIKYIAGYTDGSGNVNAKIKDVSKDALKSWLGLDLFVRNVDAVTGVIFSTNVNTNDIQLDVEKADGTVVNVVVPEATEFNNGIISKEDKVKLNGIASGANNYTLPTASDTTLGGIKVSANANGSSWPICVDGNGLAYTKIKGLNRNSFDNTISNISIKNNSYSSIYDARSITMYNGNDLIASLALPDEPGRLALESDIPTKTSQLTNDSTFLTSADKYILPVASQNTLGGILSYPISGSPNNFWPIIVSAQAVAYTNIAGLNKNSNGDIANIIVKSSNYSTTYAATVIQKVDTKYNRSAILNIPDKSGTLAITSDIPDVSSLCKFNFVNSISDCVNGRINFLFKNSNEYVDLSFLRNLEEGTISLIYSPFVDFQITDKGSVWYYNGRSIASEDTAYIGKAKLVLAFFNDTYVYVCTFSYN